MSDAERRTLGIELSATEAMPALAPAHPVSESRELRPRGGDPAAIAHLPTQLASHAQGGGRPSDVQRMAALAAQLPPHLTLHRPLGEGGSSVVYEAFHQRLKVPVAVKVLAVRGELADSARARMMREAELYALLDDPRIPRVYDVNELPDGTPYVVMEMVPGTSLEKLLTQHPMLPIPLTLAITREILLALRAVHAKGVLHRDIKPANVILAFENDGGLQVRLVDFGIAKAAAVSTDIALTQRGALVGTPQYMAPERLTGQAADLTSETYAVGIMLYEMLGGTVPFSGQNLGSILAAVLRDTPTPLHMLRSDLPTSLEALVMRAISRTPLQRFPDVDAMLEQLTVIEQELHQHEATSAVRRRPQPVISEPLSFEEDAVVLPPRKRSKGLVWMSLAALAVASSVWLTVHRTDDATELPVRAADVAPTAPAPEPTAPVPSEPQVQPANKLAPSGAAADAPSAVAVETQLPRPNEAQPPAPEEPEIAPEADDDVEEKRSSRSSRRRRSSARREAHNPYDVPEVEQLSAPPRETPTVEQLPDNPYR